MTRITKAELQQANTHLAAQNEALRAEVQALRAEVEALCAERQRAEHQRAVARPQTPNTSERSAQLQAAKTLAMKHHCMVRIRDGGIELYSRERGYWVAASEGAQS